MALRIYAAPNGSTFQYQEGEQPEGYVLAESQPKGEDEPKPAPKRRATANKRRAAANKAQE